MALAYNVDKIREDFPILNRSVHNRPLVYLDNAATTQKPRQVVDAISDEYFNVNANVHRGVHFLSQQASILQEAKVRYQRLFFQPLPRFESKLTATSDMPVTQPKTGRSPADSLTPACLYFQNPKECPFREQSPKGN